MLTDAELVQEILAGRQSAMGELVRRYEAPLGRFVKRMCMPCTPYRDDILQDAFLKCYRHLHEYDSGLKFSSWIYRITHNAVVDHIRSRRLQNAMTSPIIDEEVFSGNLLHPESKARQREFEMMSQRILAQMPENLRSAFILRFLEEKDYAEIGDILKENVNTIATWIRRAKDLFRKAAHEQEFPLQWEEENGTR